MCGDLFFSFLLLFIYWDCLTQLQVKADASITSRGNNFTQIMLVVMHAKDTSKHLQNTTVPFKPDLEKDMS